VKRYAWVSWALMAIVLGSAFAIGLTRDPTPHTGEERVQAIASRLKCPTCRSQSVASSDAPAAVAVRAQIAKRVQAGQSDDAIVGYVVSRFGDDISLVPPRWGIGGLVWVLPVAAFVAAVAGLAFAFRRWQATSGLDLSDDDRVRVEQARRHLHDREPV
jgi:cytochrome c-type biogenesis protein CcmH